MSDDAAATESNGLRLQPPMMAQDEEAPHPEDDRDVDAEGTAGATEEPDEDEEDDEEEDEDEEAKLKYGKLTDSLSGIYRNGDSTSAFVVAGDKMAIGTHNGNIHVFGLPGLQSVRSWKAHNATVTSVSVSPTPPPPQTVRHLDGSVQLLSTVSQGRGLALPARDNPRGEKGRQQQQQSVPNIPSNQVYVATSSLDGHVCIQSLVDHKDVQLRNFARPVQAIALSPDYRNDQTYLSGGLAGQLILTVGGKAGVSADANTNSAAATASGWLSSIGLGTNTGRDTILHSGEGAIHNIKWSLSGKWVVWVNEEGIKIMRSQLKLGSEDSEDAWRRIAHAAKPNRKGWRDMAGVWKARCEWIDDEHVEADEALNHGEKRVLGTVNGGAIKAAAAIPTKRSRKIERLLVGWGDTAWILHVQPGVGYTAHSGQKQVGTADIMHKLHFTDCIISGISLYTPSTLAILAYRTRDDDDKPILAPASSENNSSSSRGGGARKQKHRRTGLRPQLRMIDIKDGAEIVLDELPISRFEILSAQDYHLSTLYMPQSLAPGKSMKEQRSALEAAWEAAGGGYASRLFTSGASVMSGSSGSGKDDVVKGLKPITSPQSSTKGQPISSHRQTAVPPSAHPYAIEPGLKIFIHSPFDSVIAVKRDLSDHLIWLLDHERYAEAWRLIDVHPDIVDASIADRRSCGSRPSTPGRSEEAGSLAEFFADSDSVRTLSASVSRAQVQQGAAEKEKRRIGDLWVQQLVAKDDWTQAGRVAGKVLGTSRRWEHWVWTFAQANHFDEITPYIPSTTAISGVGGIEEKRMVLPSMVYEVILGHYIAADPARLKELLDLWDPELFDVGSVITAIEDRLRSGEVNEKSIEDGEHGKGWMILVDALAKLYLADGRPREALKCYIRAQNADAAMSLIKEEKLMDAIDPQDIPGLILLRISQEQMRSAPLSELEEASAEPIGLLVDEALLGTVLPGTVIRQLQWKGDELQPFLYFYLRSLWRGPQEKQPTEHKTYRRQPRRKFDYRVDEGHALVEDHADLAVQLFAEYDRELLMTFLRASTIYSYEKAAHICEHRHYIPELVYILSKTGQTRRALSLIIGELGDVSQAISFAKENGELWDDLLDYSMGKPRFIKGLLEEVGTAIEPAKMVRRIPEGLEIEGLKDGIQKLVREYEIQFSISEGVAKVLRGEVAMDMDTLRAGQKKAVRFEVVHENPGKVDLLVEDPPTVVSENEDVLPMATRKSKKDGLREGAPGHCLGCGEAFHEEGQSSDTEVHVVVSHVLTDGDRKGIPYRLRV